MAAVDMVAAMAEAGGIRATEEVGVTLVMEEAGAIPVVVGATLDGMGAATIVEVAATGEVAGGLMA